MRNAFKIFALAILMLAIVTGTTIVVRHLSWQQRLAIQPASTETLRVLQAIRRDAATRNTWITFTTVPVPSAVSAGEAVRAQRADLAVLRADIAVRSELQTLGIVAREHVFLIVPANSSIDSFKGLANHKVGLLPSSVNNEPLLDRLLEFYNIAPASVSRMSILPAEAGRAIQQRRIAAILVVGVPGRGLAAEAFAAVARATRSAPSLVGVEEADAVVSGFPRLESGEIAKGAFSGLAPGEAITTVTLAYHLVADRRMSNWVAGQISRSLMDAKANLISEPGVAGIEAADTEQSNYAVHPGARAYFDGEKTNVLDSLSSLFWIGSAILGFIGSVATWTAARLIPGKVARDNGLSHLLPLLRQVREVDIVDLDALGEKL